MPLTGTTCPKLWREIIKQFEVHNFVRNVIKICHHEVGSSLEVGSWRSALNLNLNLNLSISILDTIYNLQFLLPLPPLPHARTRICAPRKPGIDTSAGMRTDVIDLTGEHECPLRRVARIVHRRSVRGTVDTSYRAQLVRATVGRLCALDGDHRAWEAESRPRGMP